MNVEILLRPKGLAKILLDGHDISSGVRAYRVDHEAPGQTPVLVLDPLIIDQGSVTGDMKVYISPEASDLPGDAS